MYRPLLLKIIIILLVLIVFVIAFFNQIVSVITSTRVNFDYIEAAGGLNLGKPILKDSNYYLPIECDAIGKFINKQPKNINSAPLVFYKSVVKQKKNEILFYLKLRLDKNYEKAKIRKIKLGYLKPGKYKIYYLNDNGKTKFIKEILVE